ncbi:hypothetical protein [Urbifossiella limnaea]|uniref:Uncharacterized protein n=1 Tax=Urbifossiella limnaea TaxID=2528023 RepID=A0A517XV78_9BACT|nr:hypothetical protein [Urbifossiella limnaea]QDU21420.1 hypothetical protein ETAA1_33870 [Urbifossiella limnaea]
MQSIGGDLSVELFRFRDLCNDAPQALDGLARVLVAAGQLEAANRVWAWVDQAQALSVENAA